MTHIVKPGESLSKIAKANGITLAHLLDANPQFKAHPDDMQAGDELIIPGEELAATLQPQPQPLPADRILGELSEKFETGGRGAGTVSGGQGDPGGASYGSYQMSSKLARDGRTLCFPTRFPFSR